VDESATGSANFFGPESVSIARHMHLRPPSFDHGTVSGLWAIGLGLLILVGSVALGLDTPTAFIVAGLAAGAIFIYVRLYGEEELRR